MSETPKLNACVEACVAFARQEETMYQTAARHTRNFLTPKRQPVSSVSHLIKYISLNRHYITDGFYAASSGIPAPAAVIARRFAPKQSRQGIPTRGVCASARGAGLRVGGSKLQPGVCVKQTEGLSGEQEFALNKPKACSKLPSSTRSVEPSTPPPP
jgi:hypothetical protein